MSKQEFNEIFELLKINYAKEIESQIEDVWFDEFKDMTKEDFKKRVINWIAKETTFPTIHEVSYFSELGRLIFR